MHAWGRIDQLRGRFSVQVLQLLQAGGHLHLRVLVGVDLTPQTFDFVVTFVQGLLVLLNVVSGFFDFIARVLVLLRNLFGVVQLVLNALNVQLQLLLDLDVVAHLRLILLQL